MEPKAETAAHADPLKAVQERLKPQLDEAQAQLGALNERVKSFIVENPGKCLVGALALGYVVGRLASRR